MKVWDAPILTARILVSALLLYFAIRGIRFEDLWSRLAGTKLAWFLSWLFLAVLANLVQVFFGAMRWKEISALCNTPLGLLQAFRYNMIGTFFNQTLPSTIGGDAMRLWLVKLRWPRFFEQNFRVAKWIVGPGLSCRTERQRVEVGLIGSTSVKGCVRSPSIVEGDVVTDRLLCLADAFVGMQPVSIAGWGLREATMMLAFGYSGLNQADGTMVSLLTSVTSFLVGAIGGLVLIFSREKVETPDSAISDTVLSEASPS